MRHRALIRSFWQALGLMLIGLTAANAASPAPAAAPVPSATGAAQPMLQLGVGDELRFEVYGQPDMTSTLTVADDGTVIIPLAGAVKVVSMSPTEAAKATEKALRTGGYLVNPHVTITITKGRSQLISVLGEVGKPGRYDVDNSTSIFDLLALAGGVTANGAQQIYLLRTDPDGTVHRFPINLGGFDNSKTALPTQTLQAGDSIFVPRAEKYSIYGEVTAPNEYHLESGMTVIQAITRAGGVTVRGSERRIEIKRKNAAGKYITIKAKLDDIVQPDDVIRVKESLF